MGIDVRDNVLSICVTRLHELGIADDRHRDRLKYELKEITAQMEHEYLFDLYEKKLKFPNDNNLLVCYLLGLTDEFDIEQEQEHIIGEMPDADIDYIQEVRDYLKNDWAPKTFGVDNVCAIGNYTTFGIKSSLLDMARVHGKDRQEIQSLTTKIGLKDDDGKALTFEKALEQYPDLKKYCDENPEVADSAKRLLNRNRGMGMHAGGLIISSVPINRLVPLVRGKDGQHVSAFVEGLHGTDLGPLGLIKFDLLVITNLMQIALACKIIKDRHGIKSINALPGQSDWSDTSYLNDPKSIDLANEGKLKCVFQFDSKGIRDLVRSGGVGSFDDLVAYTALYRPGPMGLGMHDAYVRRKRGHEKYDLHPILEPIIGKTYGVMAYQEDLMKILRVVGNIPDMHTEIVRKAISKKKVKVFGRYKEMFLRNGQKNLGWSEKQVEELWQQIEAFAEYGFNLAHATAYSYISSRLLWLKAHYPLEFFTAILSCEKDNSKIKEYKREAEAMEIPVHRIDVNKSHDKFAIVDEAIYMGFSNIKGVGPDIAKRVMDQQPYTSFEDFLHRFGTDASVVKALIALRIFDDADPVKLYSYYEYYKAEVKKIDGRKKRFATNRTAFMKAISDILIQQELSVSEAEVSSILENFSLIDDIEPLCQQLGSRLVGRYDVGYDPIEIIQTTIKRYRKSKETFTKKESESNIVGLDDYDSSIELDRELKEVLCEVPQVAENKFYGFSWNHLLESSPDYHGNRTFADFDEDETILVRACELHVVERPKRKVSKKSSKTVFYTIMMEDANSRPEMVTFWEDDYNRFQEELEFWEGDSRKGNYLSLHLKKPDGGFKNYTFDSPPKRFRDRDIPKDKNLDHRFKILARPTLLLETEKVETINPKTLITLHDVLVVK